MPFHPLYQTDMSLLHCNMMTPYVTHGSRSKSSKTPCLIILIYVCINLSHACERGVDGVKEFSSTIIDSFGKISYLSIAKTFRGNKFKQYSCSFDPDICRNASELVRCKGYPFEQHAVLTEDGFILALHRIPHGRRNVGEDGSVPRPVVFLQHGLLSSSVDWFINSVNQSLAFKLADSGFDVWLGNVRGNTYSRRHKTLKPSQSDFWNWSWDEIAAFDIPAMIEYALLKTKRSKLFYIGHSQGTLVNFALLSENNKFARKISAFFALGPVARVGHITSPIRYLSYLSRPLQVAFHILGINEFLPRNILLQFISATLCNSPFVGICDDLLFLVAGPDVHHLNQTRIPVYLSHAPSGTSVQNIIHFSQMVKSNKFQKYDYGSPSANEFHYGQPIPPQYNISNIACPVYIYAGGLDALADPRDVCYLRSKLPNVANFTYFCDWDHLDFLWGYDAAQYLYDPIIREMKRIVGRH